ncbi:MAG: DNA cytosine methyltransferase [Symploca sp. SIO2G7]|nr:DNA cytosine methyltransferase [Symploca sp. SIO2G7]
MIRKTQCLTMNSVELFTGAGGLAIGISNAGFRHQAAIERDKDACFTIRSNQKRGIQAVTDWPIFQADVTQFDFTTVQVKGGIDLLAGGPPCQPFSQGGKHQGWDDSRDMFPQFFRAVRELKPKAILVENVKGLLRSVFSQYFEYIILQLTYPEIVQKSGEDWVEHLSRLEQHHTVSQHDGLSYRVVFRNLNAADYGIPQKRNRVFIIGFRSDLSVEWSFPAPTHSQEAMLWEQWVTGDYWERHQVPLSKRPEVPSKQCDRIYNLQSSLFPPVTKPWRTVRDAIGDLPVPDSEESNSFVLNHVLIPGARKYPGHTGSLLDEPAKTLKAGVHGVPGGENMLAFHTGEVRYFTVREAARLQTFPDEYFFPHCWTQTMRQLGNAVPVVFAEVLAASIRRHLLKVKAI